MKAALSLLGLLFTTAIFAQVNWVYSPKKVSDKTYEVNITATVTNPWHIYSQTTPEGGPVATEIVFTKNPLIMVTGKPKEVGKLKEKFEKVFGVDVKYYDGKVTFTQIIKLKSNVKTSIAGTIEYMACNEEQCLPPKKINFTIKLE
jgi:thiol:disulfide interchange protein DsbD